MGLHSNLHLIMMQDDHCISKIHHHNYLYHVHHGHHNNDQEVFTDMSVLPLVFPDNMSCFSRGSYKVRFCFEEFASSNVLLVLSMGIIVWMRKLPGVFCVAQIKRHHGDISIDVMILTIFQEELARKRQLPVPPMPRRGPRAIARSEDNVSGESCLWWKLNMSL